jgi:hypothetical protein
MRQTGTTYRIYSFRFSVVENSWCGFLGCESVLLCLLVRGTNIPEEHISSVFSFEGWSSYAEMLVRLSRTAVRSHDPEYCGTNAYGTLKGCCDDQAGNGRTMKTGFFLWKMVGKRTGLNIVIYSVSMPKHVAKFLILINNICCVYWLNKLLHYCKT